MDEEINNGMDPSHVIIPYVFILTNFPELKIQPCNHSDNPGEFISVIVPCRNAAEHLPGLIKCIGNQNYDSDLFELIIIDDNSDDPSYIPDSEHNSLKNLKVLKNEGRGKKKAIMTGVSASVGSYIITTDADCLPGEKWLSTIVLHSGQTRCPYLSCDAGKQAGFFFFRNLNSLVCRNTTGTTVVDIQLCAAGQILFSRKRHISNVTPIRNPIRRRYISSSQLKENNNIKWLESEEAASSVTLEDYINQRKVDIKSYIVQDTFLGL